MPDSGRGGGRLRAAIIGCGQVAGGYEVEALPDAVLTHVKAYRLEPAVELVAVADTDFAKAESFARRWGVSGIFPSARRLLAEARPDLISICTPDDTHADLLRLCAEFPVSGVWCEKPLDADLAAARAAMVLYRERGLVLAVNYMRRWLEEVDEIRRLLAAQALGTVRHAVGYYTRGIRHNGSHTVDLLMYLFGDVTAATVVGGPASGDDPTLDARLQFADGTCATLIGLPGIAFSLWELDIIGARGRVRLKRNGLAVEWYHQHGRDPLERSLNLLAEPVVRPTRLDKIMTRVAGDVVRAVIDGTALRSDGASALRTLTVCTDLLAQSLKRRVRESRGSPGVPALG